MSSRSSTAATVPQDGSDVLEKGQETQDMQQHEEKTGLPVNVLYPPDMGLRAWLCVFGAWWGFFCSFGYINCLGIFQEYYIENQLSSYSASTTSWINSLQIFIMVFSSVVFGRVYDMFGPRPLLIPGAILLALGVMTTSACKEYYQFILAQGICTALGASAIYNASMSAVSGWFIKKRGAALGLSVSGSSFGGVILPIVFRLVLKRSNFGWAVRSVGFLMTFAAVMSCLTITSRFIPKGVQRVDVKRTILMPYLNIKFTVIAFGIFLIYWGLFVPIGFIPTHASFHGFSASMADYLVSIMNGASFFGRVIPGILADKLGRFNTFIACCTTAGILVLGLWLPATGHVPIILFAALFGFASGASISLMPALIAEISPIHEIGTRIGAVSAFASFAALSGMPISGAILLHDHNSFTGVAVFGGVTLIGGCFFVGIARLVLSKGKLIARV
ncbi:major facilitator superfamily domain-containing protein [Lipomyces orientalis]|uniref:Major facilitator superfamily domain-containing protein n=1 Tax=Lipomyces orientalis TaxID=1233043 RepID=A0ACC3TGZ6_9ASCO